MRKPRTGFCVSIVAAVVLCVAVMGVLAASNKLWFHMGEKTDAYIFPKYESEEVLEWDNVVAFNQVPEDVLKSMSTDGLIETCLDYPLFSLGMITSNDSLYAGFMRTRSEFNGIGELFIREDAGAKLLNLYKNINLKNLVSSSDSYTTRLRYFEYILAQNEVIMMLNSDEKQTLKTTCLNMIAEKASQYKDVLSFDSTLLIVARIFMTDNIEFANYVKSHESVSNFVEYGILSHMTVEEVEEIFSILDISFDF